MLRRGTDDKDADETTDEMQARRQSSSSFESR